MEGTNLYSSAADSSELDEDDAYWGDTIINLSTLSSTNNNYRPDVSYNPDSVEIDSAYDQNIKMPSTFVMARSQKI